MSMRYYPNPEGTIDASGREYPNVDSGFIRKEFENFIDAIKIACHIKGYNLSITSLNHGRHVGNSMHYKGLAMDFNLKDSNGEWLDFKTQGEIAGAACDAMKADCWQWTSDHGTHTHVSVHPANAIPFEQVIPTYA